MDQIDRYVDAIHRDSAELAAQINKESVLHNKQSESLLNTHMVQCSNHEPGKPCDIYSCPWKCGSEPCRITTQHHG